MQRWWIDLHGTIGSPLRSIFQIKLRGEAKERVAIFDLEDLTSAGIQSYIRPAMFLRWWSLPWSLCKLVTKDGEAYHDRSCYRWAFISVDDGREFKDSRIVQTASEGLVQESSCQPPAWIVHLVLLKRSWCQKNSGSLFSCALSVVLILQFNWFLHILECLGALSLIWWLLMMQYAKKLAFRYLEDLEKWIWAQLETSAWPWSVSVEFGTGIGGSTMVTLPKGRLVDGIGSWNWDAVPGPLGINSNNCTTILIGPGIEIQFSGPIPSTKPPPSCHHNNIVKRACLVRRVQLLGENTTSESRNINRAHWVYLVSVDSTPPSLTILLLSSKCLGGRRTTRGKRW